MGNKIMPLFSILIIGIFTVCSFGEGYITPKGGLLLPLSMRDLKGSEQCVWNFGAEWGGLTDIGVGFGGSFDISWQHSYHVIDADTSGIIQQFDYDKEIRRTMLPLGAVLYIDPMFDKIVHPAFKASGGPALLIYTYREYDSDGDEHLTKNSGAYWGFFGKVGADLHVNLSEQVSVFAGIDYLWSSLTKHKFRSTTRYVQDLSGPMFRVGLRFL